MNTEERLDRIERQNRNLRCALVGLPLLLLVVSLAAFMWPDTKPQSKVIRARTVIAEAIELVDANGVRRCQLHADKDQSNLVFLDKKGNIRLVVGFLDNGTGGVKMFDATYQPTVALTMAEDRKQGQLVLYDGAHRAVTLASQGSMRVLAFDDGTGKPRVLLRHRPEDTKLGFFNGDPSQPRVALGIQYGDRGRTRHDLWDKDGKPLKWDK